MSNKRGKMVRVSPEMRDLLLTEKEKRGNKHITDTSREVAREFRLYTNMRDVLNKKVEKETGFKVFK